MNVEQLVASMTPTVYENLKQAVEIGKWPDGGKLTDEQRENSLQAVMLYQARVEQSEEHMTIGKAGEVIQKSRQILQQEFASEQTIARFKQNDI